MRRQTSYRRLDAELPALGTLATTRSGEVGEVVGHVGNEAILQFAGSVRGNYYPDEITWQVVGAQTEGKWQTEGSELHLADRDYPELGDILGKPAPAIVQEGNEWGRTASKTAAAKDVEQCPNCHSAHVFTSAGQARPGTKGQQMCGNCFHSWDKTASKTAARAQSPKHEQYRAFDGCYAEEGQESATCPHHQKYRAFSGDYYTPPKTSSKTAVDDNIQPLVDQLRAFVKDLAQISGIDYTFGYIGNLDARFGDDRIWSVFAPHPGRVGTSEDRIGAVRTENLAELIPLVRNKITQAKTSSKTAGMDDTLHTKLIMAVTEYDRKQQGKAGYNHYALPQYLGAVQRAQELCDDGESVRNALITCFSGRLLATVLKAAGEPKGTDDEIRFGRTSSVKVAWEIEDVRSSVDQGWYGQSGVDGTKIDQFSASALTQVYDALSPENQAKLRAMPIERAVDVAFKLIKKHQGSKVAGPPHTDRICEGSGKVDSNGSRCPVCDQETDGWHTKDGFVRKWHSDPNGPNNITADSSKTADGPGYTETVYDPFNAFTPKAGECPTCFGEGAFSELLPSGKGFGPEHECSDCGGSGRA